MPTPPSSYSPSAAEKLRLALLALAATAVAGCSSHHETPQSARTAGVLVYVPRETEVAPAAPSSMLPTKAGEYFVHDVEPDDTLSEIARRYGASVKSLMELNNLSDPNNLRARQHLFIPTEEDSSASRPPKPTSAP